MATDLRKQFSNYMTVQRFADHTKRSYVNGVKGLAVSSDCFQRKIPDAIINFLKGLPGYAAFFTSGMTAVAS